MTDYSSRPIRTETATPTQTGGAAGDLARLEDMAAVVGRAAHAAGTDGFYEALMAVFRGLARHSIVTVVRYNRFSRPDFLFHRGFSDDLARAYLDRFYELDPFYHYWRNNERPGIIGLRDFPATELKRSRYMWEFLQESRIRDEMGMFLPPVARSSVAMFLERAAGNFQPAEVERLRRFYPLMAGLHHAHVNCTFASLGSGDVGLGDNTGAATTIVDVTGDMVFANEAWRVAETTDPEVRRARATLEETENLEMEISGGRILHRETLSHEFCLAPGGWLYRIEHVDTGTRLDSPRRVFEQICPALSPRELDIVDMILHGHSTDSIAGQLHLTRGTIKNYRRHLYGKLEISSERELFLAYIDAIANTEEPPETANAVT